MNETDALLVIWDNAQFKPFLYVTFTNELFDFDFSYWTKKWISFIITISVTQILDMKWFQLLAIWVPGLNITYYWFQKPISKWPPWQSSWMSQGYEPQTQQQAQPSSLHLV